MKYKRNRFLYIITIIVHLTKAKKGSYIGLYYSEIRLLEKCSLIVQTLYIYLCLSLYVHLILFIAKTYLNSH